MEVLCSLFQGLKLTPPSFSLYLLAVSYTSPFLGSLPHMDIKGVHLYAYLFLGIGYKKTNTRQMVKPMKIPVMNFGGL